MEHHSAMSSFGLENSHVTAIVGGGGSTLTPEGRSLLERYRQWEADCKAYAKAHLADFFPEAAE